MSDHDDGDRFAQMRALTIRQPWAWAIAVGVKTVENRTQNVAGSYRGPVAIHAAKTMDEDALRDPLIIEARESWRRRTRIDARSITYSLGAVIAVAHLADVHHARDCTDPRGALCSPWALPDHYHLVLDHARTLRHPIYTTGRLGLWHPDTDLTEAITQALAEEWGATEVLPEVTTTARYVTTCPACGYEIETEGDPQGWPLECDCGAWCRPVWTR